MPVPYEATTRKPLGGDPIHHELARLPSGWLEYAFWPADENGDRYIKQGAILSQLEGGVTVSTETPSQPYYAPYSSSGAYGTGSDTAVGILAEPHDSTLSHWQVSPVNWGIAIEKRCYVPGGTFGTVPAAVKTDLSRIEWRE